MSRSNESKWKRCFCCGNVSDKENVGKVSLFHVPKNNFDSWNYIFPGLTKSSLLCERHFEEKDITRGIYVLGVFHPNERVKLLAGAIPKLFLGKL